MKNLRTLLELFYPKGLTCNGCRKELSDDERRYSLCKKCAEKLFDENGAYFGERYVRELSVENYGTIKARGCFRYEGISRDYVIDYKDADKTYLCHYMALHLTELYQRLETTADLVAYVPTSRANLRRRGYDGMRYVAESFCKNTGLPLSDHLFRLDGVDQSKVDTARRGENVKNKFLSRGGFSGTVLLLDDVVTTGATVEECAKALLSHGAQSVFVLSFAMAGLKNENGADAPSPD